MKFGLRAGFLVEGVFRIFGLRAGFLVEGVFRMFGRRCVSNVWSRVCLECLLEGEPKKLKECSIFLARAFRARTAGMYD